MKIKIVAVGKVKENFLNEGINEYLKRLSAFAKTEIVEVDDSKVKDNPSDSDILKTISEEGKRILSRIKDGDYVVNLDLNKKEMDSIELRASSTRSSVSGFGIKTAGLTAKSSPKNSLCPVM